MSDEETRVTNPLTGGEKGSKLPQLFWAPPRALIEVAKVYGYGAEKYTPNNFRKGYSWSLSYNSLIRHVLASEGGEDIDPESGLFHLAQAAWHCLTLIQFYYDKQEGNQPPELDDRWATVTAECCGGEPRTSSTCMTCGYVEGGNPSFTCAQHQTKAVLRGPSEMLGE